MFAVVGLTKNKTGVSKFRRCISSVFILYSWSPQGPGTQHLRSKCLLNGWLWKDVIENTIQTILINYINIFIPFLHLVAVTDPFENCPEGPFILPGKPDKSE